MPYIITTRRSAARLQPGESTFDARAVATLEEARNATHDRLQVEGGAPPIRSRDEYERLIDQWNAIDESGGRVGPLPDGTVIEVELTTWQWLDGQCGTVARYLREPVEMGSRERALIDAYNAQETASC